MKSIANSTLTKINTQIAQIFKENIVGPRFENWPLIWEFAHDVGPTRDLSLTYRGLGAYVKELQLFCTKPSIYTQEKYLIKNEIHCIATQKDFFCFK